MARFEPKLTWESSRDNLIEGFYRPALKEAILYQRKAGYFSSTSFASITNEILDFIARKGRIQLITSPFISTYDQKIIKDSIENREKVLSEIFLDDLRNDPDGAKEDFAKVMAYMLANEIDGKPQLEIKIAITEGLYHEKMGLIHQANKDTICFVGSNNETISGWEINTENFHAFCSWRDETNQQAIKDNQAKFDRFWADKEPNVKIVDIPTAVKEHLFKISPKSNIEYQDTLKKVHDRILKKKEDSAVITEPIESTEKGLRDYQKEAIEKWIENNYRGIFAMATGTGKTINACGCINRLQQKEKRTVTIIAAPYTHLVEQWKSAVEDYNNEFPEEDRIKIDDQVLCYGEKNWRREIETILGDFNEKYFSGDYPKNNFIIYVTHATLNSQDFKDYILRIKDAKKLLIADEVHEIGAELSQASLLEEYDYRLGLSATPIRHYDPDGTAVLANYFEKTVYELELEDAIKMGFLCEYEYHPIYAELTSSEMEVYDRLTGQIAAKLSNKKYTRKDEDYENNPEIKRANLVGAAENKMQVLESIINELLNNEKLKKTLIYCTSNPSPNLPFGSPKQLEDVQRLLSDKHITHKSITFHDPTKERGQILDALARGHVDCVPAVRCLDQGVDIPSVETAIIMASSGNPKQYIQRRGRVLRPSTETGKEKAVIYDLLIKPPPPNENSSIRLRERRLTARELLRHKEFASIAINKDEAFEKIKSIAELYDIDLKRLDSEYIDNME